MRKKGTGLKLDIYYKCDSIDESSFYCVNGMIWINFDRVSLYTQLELFRSEFRKYVHNMFNTIHVMSAARVCSKWKLFTYCAGMILFNISDLFNVFLIQVTKYWQITSMRVVNIETRLWRIDQNKRQTKLHELKMQVSNSLHYKGF